MGVFCAPSMSVGTEGIKSQVLAVHLFPAAGSLFSLICMWVKDAVLTDQ